MKEETCRKGWQNKQHDWLSTDRVMKGMIVLH